MLLAGCGGNGGSNSGETSDFSRTDALALIEQGAAAAVAGTTRPAGLARTREPGAPRFDEYFELWAVDELTGTILTTTYYLEEALTTPAGQTTYNEGVGTEPNLVRSSATTLTAGPKAGYTSVMKTSVVEQNGALTLTITENDPQRGSSTMNGQFNLFTGGGSFTTVTQKDGMRVESTTTYVEDGSYVQTLSNDRGVTLTINGNTDGSASGTIQGNGEGLPATFVWDVEGRGEITWADGSKTPLDLEVLRSQIYG
jgi:hypothetical protein